ncbi:MAG: acetate--CoA ligase [Chloroflexia bacterium]|nr:acetate--CoA ligase [Chloroflexia bacterium]
MLEALFQPRSVAVIGASSTPGKMGYILMDNIIRGGFEGEIYPINPKGGEIMGRTAYPTILDVPEGVDLAVIVVPAKYIPDIVDECGEKGVGALLIISAGFRETGPEGARLERDVAARAEAAGMRILGPNVLGLIDTISKLNATFATTMAKPGNIAFFSQSGALGSAILDWSLEEGIGFSHFASLGNKADITEVDLLEAWEDDPHSRVILAYLEGITDGEKFMQVARRVTRKRPIIAIKSGTTQAGTRAISSHTGSLAGSERAYEAAFRQCGIIRADSVQDLFDFAELFSYQPMLRGDRIAIVTNAGGPGILATDMLERAGLELARFGKDTIEAMRPYLPSTANLYNPVDVIGDARSDRYRAAMEAVLQDAGVDGLVVLLTPQAMTDIEDIAHTVVEIAKAHDKPVVTSFMGGEEIRPAEEIFQANGLPTYPFPERAVMALGAMERQRLWLERPRQQLVSFSVDRERVQEIFEKARLEHRLNLGEVEARDVMEAYGLALPQSRLARSPDEAVRLAGEIGYPVVLKIASPDILHKSDIGAVKIGLSSSGDVRDAFELIEYRAHRHNPDADVWGVLVQQMIRGGKEVIIGMSRDPQFGPLLMFGLGGIYVEVMKDVVFRIAPIDRSEAREMVEHIRSYPLLKGVRGEAPADIPAIIDTILRVSQLVTDFTEIVELDINPLIVHEAGQGATVLDARMILQG